VEGIDAWIEKGPIVRSWGQTKVGGGGQGGDRIYEFFGDAKFFQTTIKDVQ